MTGLKLYLHDYLIPNVLTTKCKRRYCVPLFQINYVSNTFFSVIKEHQTQFGRFLNLLIFCVGVKILNEIKRKMKLECFSILRISTVHQCHKSSEHDRSEERKGENNLSTINKHQDQRDAKKYMKGQCISLMDYFPFLFEWLKLIMV